MNTAYVIMGRRKGGEWRVIDRAWGEHKAESKKTISGITLGPSWELKIEKDPSIKGVK